MSTAVAVPDPERVTDACFTDDGTLLAFLYTDGSVRVFQSDEKRVFTQVAETPPCCRHAIALSFASSDLGGIFVIADDSGRTFLYDRVEDDTFTLVITMQPHKAPINSVAFAPTGLSFACGSSDGLLSLTTCDQKAWSWQLSRCSNSPVTSVSWSPLACMSFVDRPNLDESARLVAGSSDGFFNIFTVRGISLVPDGSPVRAHEGAVYSVAWRPLPGFARWEIASCGADGQVILWTKEKDWTQQVICSCDEPPSAVKWSQCGFMLSVSVGQNVRLFREDSQHVWTEMRNGA